MMGKGGAQESASGSQRDYLDGLNHLRTLVTEVELDIDRAQREFYKAETSDADEFEKHLKKSNKMTKLGSMYGPCNTSNCFDLC